MKLSSILCLSALALVAPLTTRAQMITPSAGGSLGTMPGSATDYTFFGNANQFPHITNYYGNTTQPTVLTDFTVAPGANGGATYEGDNRYSTINGPVGSGEPNVQTGILFGGGADPDLVDFTLGTPGSTFNFSDFETYVMYGNGYGDGGVRDTSISASLYSSTGALLATETVPIVDNPAGSDGNASPVATFEDFQITGATSGDILRFGAVGNTTYLGGVSFESVPEPSTWIMMLAGVAFLIGFSRSSLRT
jgi:hypothetical protein